MSENEKVKSPEEYAEIEVNKRVGKAIARRRQKIKKLEEEIRKLKSGEMTPEDEDDEESSHHNQKEEKVKEIIRERIIEKPSYPIYPIHPNIFPEPSYPKPRPMLPQPRWKRYWCNVSNYKKYI